MGTPGLTSARLDAVAGPSLARIGALRAQCAALRERSSHSHQTALQRCQDSARILADARRSRGELLRERIPRDRTCGAVARRLIEKHLASAPADQIDAAKTIASELVNNAFLHGKGTIELRVSRRRGRARIQVIDQGHGVDVRAAQRDEYHGLDIVDALSLAWGTRAGSTHVWAELPASV
jgi:signal transduction histidine kinase